MKNLFVRFVKDNSGATAIEYGLIAALIAVVIITALTSIGTNLTSGCTGLLTQDMIDLYERTPVKTKVVVLPA